MGSWDHGFRQQFRVGIFFPSRSWHFQWPSKGLSFASVGLKVGWWSQSQKGTLPQRNPMQGPPVTLALNVVWIKPQPSTPCYTGSCSTGGLCRPVACGSSLGSHTWRGLSQGNLLEATKVGGLLGLPLRVPVQAMDTLEDSIV